MVENIPYLELSFHYLDGLYHVERDIKYQIIINIIEKHAYIILTPLNPTFI